MSTSISWNSDQMKEIYKMAMKNNTMGNDEWGTHTLSSTRARILSVLLIFNTANTSIRLKPQQVLKNNYELKWQVPGAVLTPEQFWNTMLFSA